MRRVLLLVLMLLVSGCGEGVSETATPLPTDVPGAPGPTAPPPTAPAESPVPATRAPEETAEPAASAESAGSANADVAFVRALQQGDAWTFHVTVSHPDTGWEDYADGWDVVLPDGTVLKPDAGSAFTRLLLHPHVDEQPFTRSQSGIVIPAGISTVTVRAHDLVDGFGGQEVVVDLDQQQGERYSVEH